jgi:transmembrane sensor
MSEQHRPNLSQIEQQAVGWVQKLASGNATAEEIASAKRWRMQDPHHQKAFEDAERIWQRMAVVGRAKYGPDANFMGPLRDYGRQRAVMTRRAMLGAAFASIGGAAIYGAMRPPLGLWPSVAEMRADFRTGTGEQRTVAFAGDVEIALNTQTSLAVRPATATEERVELISGEASFTTPSGSSRALAVFAADGKIVSQAGQFELRYLGAGRHAVVTCLEGQLRVESGAQVAELNAKQRVFYDGLRVGEIDAVDPGTVSEWRRGIVTFRNTPLAEAVEEMNRYRSGRIILSNAAQGKRLLSGRFRIDQMEQALVQVENTFKLTVTRYPAGIVVLS